MRTIAQLTDFGADSFYVGALRAVLNAAAPGAPTVDVTHGITPHAVAQASFVLDRVLDWFAPGTVFLAVVDPGVGGERRNLIVETGGRFIVGPDNGLVGEVVARHGLSRAVAIDENRLSRYRAAGPMGRTFLGRDVFAPAAAAVALGVDPSDLGDPAEELAVPSLLPELVVGEGHIRGAGRFADGFGNILSNISVADVDSAFPDRAEVDVTIASRRAGRLRGRYDGAPRGELIAVVNSWDLVEVAMNQGRAIDVFAGAAVESLVIDLAAAGGSRR
jgi:S-adenosylmethionine hydrolase